MGKSPPRCVIGDELMIGFFLVDKPKNCTSQWVVNQIKKKFNLKKCGHNGTLDPNTTGLMIIACDEATRLMKFLVNHDKAYDTTIVFGYDSDTLDGTGTILKEEDMTITEEQLQNALKKLQQQKTQVPPIYSAIKMNGKKLYEYAREKEDVSIHEREVALYDVSILSPLRQVNHHFEVDLRLHCSKGFYVRSFARDLGKALGGCAIMKELRRIISGHFSVEEATPLADLKIEHCISLEEMFPDFDRFEANDFIARLATNGVILDDRQIKTEKPFYVIHKNDIIAIYESVAHFQYKPVLILKK